MTAHIECAQVSMVNVMWHLHDPMMLEQKVYGHCDLICSQRQLVMGLCLTSTLPGLHADWRLAFQRNGGKRHHVCGPAWGILGGCGCALFPG